MDEQADRAAKVTGIVCDTWVTAARDEGLCSPECAKVLQGDLPRLVLFRGDDLTLPQDWLSEDPDVRNRIAEELNSHLPTGGLPASFHKAVLDTICNLASFVNMIEKTGSWTSRQELSESQLQAKLREHLFSREVPVVEGSKLGGWRNRSRFARSNRRREQGLQEDTGSFQSRPLTLLGRLDATA